MNHLFNPPPLTEEVTGTQRREGVPRSHRSQSLGSAAARNGLLVCHVGFAS